MRFVERLILLPLLASTILPVQGGASFLLPECEHIEKGLEAHPVADHSPTIIKLCLDHEGRAIKRLYSTQSDTGDVWHSRDLPLNTRDKIQIHARSRRGMLLMIVATGAGALYLSSRHLRAMEIKSAQVDLAGALERLEAMKYDAPERPFREGLPAREIKFVRASDLRLPYQTKDIEVSAQKLSETMVPKWIPRYMDETGARYIVQRNPEQAPDVREDLAEYVAYLLDRSRGQNFVPRVGLRDWDEGIYKTFAHPLDLAKQP